MRKLIAGLFLIVNLWSAQSFCEVKLEDLNPELCRARWVIKDFLENKNVQAKISELKDQGYTLGTPTHVLLDAKWGMAHGCNGKYLVTMPAEKIESREKRDYQLIAAVLDSSQGPFRLFDLDPAYLKNIAPILTGLGRVVR